MIDWEDLRFLLAVARGDSHAAAARALGVDATTVGRRLGALETGLGARLLQRTPSGWRPTDAGATLLARAEHFEAELADAEASLGGADLRVHGPVRVSGGDGILHHVVAPALPGLYARHPELLVELRPETRVVDLARREADVAVRMRAERSPATISRRLPPMAMGIYAGRPLLAAGGTPASLRDLAGRPWLDYDASMARLPQNRWLRRAVPAARIVFRATTTTALAQACAAGLGLCILPARVAETVPALVRLLPRQGPPPRDAYVVYREDLRRRAAVTAVAEWLVRLFQETR